MLTIKLQVLLLLLTTASASFNPDTLPGSFRLVFGLTICPDIITFTQPGISHPSSTLLFDTRPITGGTLNLIPNPRSGGSGFLRHFSVHPHIVGRYYGGRLTKRVQWDTSALGTDTQFVFFTPEVTFRTTWEDVIGKGQPLEFVSGVPVYWFKERQDYIVINNRCLLRRDSSVASGTGNAVGDTQSSGGSCFPADATVITPRGETRIDRLNTGDSVWTGTQFSQVFLWTHRDPFSLQMHITIVLSNNNRLTLTPGHYVYIDNQTIAAEDVGIGDCMSTISGDATVVNLFKVLKRGLYNPQLKAGDIVVDGVRVTTFTKAVPPFVAHALLAPVRLAFDVWRLAGDRSNIM